MTTIQFAVARTSVVAVVELITNSNLIHESYLHEIFPEGQLSGRIIPQRPVMKITYAQRNPFNRSDNTIYIQYSGESNYKDPSLFDINFIPSNETSNCIVFPYAAFNILHEKLSIDYFLNKRNYDTTLNNKFCLFAVSNGDCSQRNNFYNKLSKYKHIDSCGKYLNNMNGNKCPGKHNSQEFRDFISNYKFMICFENVSKPNYFTEKLINAYYSKTIPIYWGCPNIADYINMDSILYLKPDFSEDDVNELIKTIEHLDNHPDEYKKKYESIFFKNGLLPDEFNIETLRKKVNKLLL